jgi:N-acetylmuramoyl-L-alanine amidase
MENQFERLVEKYPEGPIHFLIPGHGGVDKDGKYHIIKAGSKQAEVNGKMIYEGEHNRRIVEAILKGRTDNLRMTNLVQEVDDISLSERVERINAATNVYTDAGYLPLVWECHLNAFNGKASGTEVYTTRGNNFSDTMATIWWNEAIKVVGAKFPDYKWRSDKDDGDVDKEKDFTVIKKSNAYAILIEFFFFDHPWSVETFCNDFGYNLWAKTVINAMEVINKKWVS